MRMPSKLPRAASIVAASMLAAAPCAASGCDAALTHRFHECLRLVDSLKPDKAGLPRVYGADGSQFTPAQALWMKGQLQKIEAACARGDPADAARRLTAVQDLLAGRRGAS